MQWSYQCNIHLVRLLWINHKTRYPLPFQNVRDERYALRKCESPRKGNWKKCPLKDKWLWNLALMNQHCEHDWRLKLVRRLRSLRTSFYENLEHKISTILQEFERRVLWMCCANFKKNWSVNLQKLPNDKSANVMGGNWAYRILKRDEHS